jgi:hypothetical protein
VIIFTYVGLVLDSLFFSHLNLWTVTEHLLL